MGLIWFKDKDYFCNKVQKRFKLEEIIRFCEEKGIAMYDSACEVRRLKDNASDKFLEIVKTSDIPALLAKIPGCRAVVTTGQKATETTSAILGCNAPETGRSSDIVYGTRKIRLIRMPSTSRAYPLALEKKADIYRNLFMELDMLP